MLALSSAGIPRGNWDRGPRRALPRLPALRGLTSPWPSLLAPPPRETAGLGLGFGLGVRFLVFTRLPD